MTPSCKSPIVYSRTFEYIDDSVSDLAIEFTPKGESCYKKMTCKSLKYARHNKAIICECLFAKQKFMDILFKMFHLEILTCNIC